MIETSLWWVALPTFAANLLVHILLWRWLKPKKDFQLLFNCFLGLPTAGYLLALGLGISFPFICYGLHILLSLNYIAIYPAVQASSPTLHLLNFIYERDQTLKKDQVIKVFLKENAGNNSPVKLLKGNWIIEKDGEVEISWFARCVGQIFVFYRRLLNLKLGEG